MKKVMHTFFPLYILIKLKDSRQSTNPITQNIWQLWVFKIKKNYNTVISSLLISPNV